MIIRSIIKLLIVTTILCGCSKDLRAPIKPACLPKGARWYGGEDGGDWILIVEERKNLYYAEIYAENDNCVLIKKGHFMSHNNCCDWLGSLPVQDAILYFDGINIVLDIKDRNSFCFLVPLPSSRKIK